MWIAGGAEMCPVMGFSNGSAEPYVLLDCQLYELQSAASSSFRRKEL
jgi:hypothetical protein